MTHRWKHDGVEANHKHPEPWSHWHKSNTVPLPGMQEIARYCPLIAAILAPLSTLLDIPALSQRWYTLDGELQRDPTVSIVLSAVGLALNVLANALLLYRFTVHSVKNNALATRISLLAWLGKAIVAAVNLIVFGLLVNNSPGYSYDEGFWCAVVSIIDSGIIVIVLLVHYIYFFREKEEADVDVRMQGKQFLLSVTIFIGVLAIQALVFSKIEGWSYVDSIYFSVQTALTIGFGDYSPVHTAGKILVFVFSVLTISLLGNEIAVIVDFFGARADERRDKWKKIYEGEMHRAANEQNPDAGLMEEMALIHQINTRQDLMGKIYDLIWSAFSLILFWVVGAAIFSSIQGWSYGNALYMVMVLSMTIGFGDFTPDQPASKVIFIVYALMAVPIVTSFAVQTISGLLSTYSDRRARRRYYQRARRLAPSAFDTHNQYIAKAHEAYQGFREKLLGNLEADDAAASTDATSSGSEAEAAETAEKYMIADVLSEEMEEDKEGASAETSESSGPAQISSKTADCLDPEASSAEIHRDLLKRLMQLVVQMETEARDLLLESMDHDIARTLLLADRNVQLRNVRAIIGEDDENGTNLLSKWRGDEAQQRLAETNKNFTHLVKVQNYRDTFAEVLVVGSILQGLEGEEVKLFERWRPITSVSASKSEEQNGERPGKLDVDVERLGEGVTGAISRRHRHHHEKRSRTIG